jgi:hypothetical protein
MPRGHRSEECSMSQCNSEVIREPQLTNTERYDVKKNKYLRGRRNTMKTIRLKNWRN